MRRGTFGVALGFVLTALLGTVPGAANGTQARRGARCSTIGARSGVMVCTKNGTTKVWSNVSTASTTLVPTPSSTSSIPSTASTPSSASTSTAPARPAVSTTTVAPLDPARYASGDIGPCRLPDLDRAWGVGVGLPHIPDWQTFVPSTGTVKGKVLVVDFPDAPVDNDRYTPGMDPRVIGPRVQQSTAFLSQQSFGRLTMDITVHPTVIRAKFPARSYFASWGTFNSRNFMSEILLAVDAEEDFAGVQIVYFVVPTLDGSFMESYAQNDNIVNAIPIDGERLSKFVVAQSANTTSWGLVAHESLHLMGLPDLYRYGSKEWSEIHPYVGGYDIMGMSSWGRSPAMFAYQRWMLGWLDDAQIACQSQSDATTPIRPMGSNGGIKAVMIPTGTGRDVVVESRRRAPYDNNPASGALVYVVDSTKRTGAGPIQVVPLYPDPSDVDMFDAPLAEGDSVTVDGVTVSVISSTPDQDVVRVKRN